MDILNPTTVVAYDYSDLSMALGINNGYNYVYLGADIVITSALGIVIDASKTSLVIDGFYPLDGTGTIHTLTDQGGDDGTIRILTSMNITFQNLNIYGRNYYGIPRVYDNTANEQTTVTYQKVTYTGPQATWHVNGLTRYIDCDITIQSTGYSAVNELAEVRWVEIGGKTTMRHNNPNGWQVFRFYKTNASLTILEGAEVEISTMQHFLFRVNDHPQITIQRNASLTLTTNQGICYDDSHRVSSFLVEAGASFKYFQKGGALGTGALVMEGPLTVQQGANVYMEANFATSDKSLIHFWSSANRGLYLNNPSSFVLYNRNTGKALSFNASSTYATPFSIRGGQVNLWETAMPMESGAGGFDDVAPNRWYKPDWSEILFEGSAYSPTSTTAVGTTVTKNTFEDEGIEPPTPISLLQLHKAQVFSVGDLPLTVDPVVAGTRRITGRSYPGAKILILYEVEPFARRAECEVEANRRFSAPTQDDEEMPLGATLSVAANRPFLLATTTATAIEEGELNITAPPLIVFVPKPIAGPPPLLPRQENPLLLVVTDLRAERTPWQIQAKLSGPLKTDENDILPNAIVFAPETGDFIVLDTEESKMVYTNDEELSDTTIELAENKGILAQINGVIRSGKQYSTYILWEVLPWEGETPGGDRLSPRPAP